MTRSVASARTVAGQRYPAKLSGLGFIKSTPYVSVPNIAALQSLTALTVEAFIYLNNYQGGTSTFNNQGYVVSYAAGFYGFTFFISGLNALGVQVENSTTGVTVTSSTNVPINQWVNISATWDGATVRVFVNGTLGSSNSFSGGNTGNPSTSLIIGNAGGSHTNGVLGTISELRISNTARYTTTYTPPTIPFVSDDNTVGLYHFSEGSGTTTADSSSNANNGTLLGSPLPLWAPGRFGLGPMARTVASIRNVA